LNAHGKTKTPQDKFQTLLSASDRIQHFLPGFVAQKLNMKHKAARDLYLILALHCIITLNFIRTKA
jgi:hypothetical protein